MNLRLIEPQFCITHKTHPQKVEHYYKLLTSASVNFPPIEVVLINGYYLVKDGNHRTRAHLKAQEPLWAYVFEPEDYTESLWLLGKRLGKIK